ncbi:DUF4435 domain-containing protein [Mucilaginibacter sp.]|uniref:DUF4435 domain-containing protein n=1 Tax=Mucilaginibacter sp. TaxID=1882438 RepID=UPI0032631CB1
MPEQLINSMLAAVANPVVAYTKFILAHKKNPQALFCFFEGQDDLIYFKPRIYNFIIPANFYEFNCSGKWNVKETYYLIKKNEVYSLCRTGFFIDLDFDQPINNPEIYETPCYSIENFYLEDIAIVEVLIDCFGVERDSWDLKTCLSIYNNLLNEFNQTTLLLNAWLSSYADLRERGIVNKRLKIDSTMNTSLDNIVKGDLSSIKPIANTSSLVNIEQLFSCIGVVDIAVVKKKVTEFGTCNKRAVFRGKFQMKFLNSFFKQFKVLVATKNNGLLSKEYHNKFEFEYSSLPVLLNSYAVTPSNLIDYIKRIRN